MAWTLHFAHTEQRRSCARHKDTQRWWCQLRVRQLHPGEKGIDAHWAIDSWLGPIRSLDVSQNRKISFHCWESNPQFHVKSFISFKTLFFPHHTLQPLRRHRTRNDCASCPRLLYITLWEINCNIDRKKATCNAAKFRNLYIVKQNKMNI